MLRQDHPLFENWDQDEAAIRDRYDQQEPRRVAAEVVAAAAELAGAFDDLDEDQWLRTGMRSDGAHFTVESFARYLIHDPVHHLHDVRRGFARLG